MTFFERRPEALLALVTLVWGSTFIITKDVVRSLAPLTYLSFRFGLGAVLLLALFPRSLRAPAVTWRDGALLGLGQGVGLLLQVFGQVYTTASKSAFLTALSTALTPLLGFLLYRDRPRAQQLAGVVLASVGLVLLTFPVGDAAWNRGDLYALACAFVYAWVIVETPRRAQRSEVGALTTVQTATAAALFITAMFAADVLRGALPDALQPHLLRLSARPFAPDARMWIQILYMSVVCTVGTFLAQTWTLRRMAATHAAVVFALEPVFATGLAIAVEGSTEWPGSRGAAGAALIVGALLVSEIRTRAGTAASNGSDREDSG